MTQAMIGPMGMLALALILAWPGCSVRAQDAPLRPVDDPEAYTVYASLLPNEWPVRAANAHLRELPLIEARPLVSWYRDSGGFMVVSAVGFNASKERAMVYMSHSCGLLCGGGSYHLLEQVDGAWREANLPTVWNCSWVS